MKSYLSLDTLSKLKKSQELPPHIHFIGIGGIGMSALAMILAKNGYSISGSDQKKSLTLKELAENQIHIYKSQGESNIDEILEVHGKNIAMSLNLPISWVNEHSSTWEAKERLKIKQDKSGKLDSATAAINALPKIRKKTAPPITAGVI